MLEIALTKFLPTVARHGYLLCKQLLNNAKLAHINHHIQSYMLKTVLFWLMKENEWNCDDETPLHIMIRIFQKLLHYIEQKNLPNFCLPQQNIFEVSSESILQAAKSFLLQYCINEKYPDDCKKILSSPFCPQIHVEGVIVDRQLVSFADANAVSDIINVESYARILMDLNMFFKPGLKYSKPIILGKYFGSLSFLESHNFHNLPQKTIDALLKYSPKLFPITVRAKLIKYHKRFFEDERGMPFDEDSPMILRSDEEKFSFIKSSLSIYFSSIL